jgi:hypothetical protein
MNGNDLFKRIELIANVSIVVVAILLSIVLVKSYLITNSSPLGSNQEADGTEVGVGQALALPDVDWEKNGQTLILALSTTCHFYTASGPFYQRLAKERGDDTRLVAVFPQTINDGKDYLNRLGVSVDEVKQASFKSNNVRGTPTLLLVNGDGVVVKEWVGKLPADQEIEVLSKVQSDRAVN